MGVDTGVVFNYPGMAQVPASCYDPIAAALGECTTVSRDGISLQVQFQSRAFVERGFYRAPLFLVAGLERVFQVFTYEEYTNCRTGVDYYRVDVGVDLSVKYANGDRRYVLRQGGFSLSVQVASKREW